MLVKMLLVSASLWIWLLLTLFMGVIGEIHDRTSPIVHSFSEMVYEEGLALLYLNNDMEGCLSHLLMSFEADKNSKAAYKLSELYGNVLRNSDFSFNWLRNALEVDPNNITTLTAVGLNYHYQGYYNIAIEHYMKAIDILRSQGPANGYNTIHPDLLPNTTPLPVSIESQLAEMFFTIGVSHQYAGDVESSAMAYDAAIQISNRTDNDAIPHYKAMLNLAALHHAHGEIAVGIEYYIHALNTMNAFNHELYQCKQTATLSTASTGSTDQLDVDVSGQCIHSSYVPWNLIAMTQTNLGAAYIQSDQIAKAEEELKNAHENLLNIQAQMNECYDLEGIGAVESKRKEPDYECELLLRSKLQIQSHLLNARKKYCNWNKWESGWMNLYRSSISDIHDVIIASNSKHESVREMNAQSMLMKQVPILSPFDSLLLPYIDKKHRLLLAESASAILSSKILPSAVYTSDMHSQSWRTPSLNQKGKVSNKLNIGFMSYDFNNHPTAHLVEAIFVEVNKHRRAMDLFKMDGNNRNMRNVFDDVNLFIYSYGRDDKSSYRRQLMELADKFVDMAALNFSESAALIYNDKIDVLLDMQLHTLGERLEITAHHPAPIQVSYLVYPGTAGAPAFLSHVVADHIVIPVESQSEFYSEKLLLLPPTYQISFDSVVHADSIPSFQTSNSSGSYPINANAAYSNEEFLVLSEKQKLRQKYDLPLDGVILANFNKIDKLDPISFQVWVQMLKRIPNSYLWLMDPTSKKILGMPEATSGGGMASPQQNMLTKSSIMKMMHVAGLSESRVLFGCRTDKLSHIKRHLAADIFVDTFVYGAHSTATDSIRGDLPVITVEGDMFPARVGSSLYSSFTSVRYNGSPAHQDAKDLKNIMVCQSLKEVEDMTVRLTNKHTRASFHSNPSTGSPSLSPNPAAYSLSSQLTMKLKYIASLGVDNKMMEMTSVSSEQTNDLRVGFMDSHHAVSKLFHSLEALFESEREEIVSKKIRKMSRIGDSYRLTNHAMDNRHFHVVHSDRI